MPRKQFIVQLIGRRTASLRGPMKEMDIWISRNHPIAEDMEFQRRTWKVERIGWSIFAAFIVLALLGLFSQGPLSRVAQEDDSGLLRISYERFQRNGASARMTIEARPEGDDTTFGVTFGHGILTSYDVERLTPTPMESRFERDGLTLVYPRPDDASAVIYVDLRPNGPGLVRGAVTVEGAGTIQISQLIFP